MSCSNIGEEGRTGRQAGCIAYHVSSHRLIGNRVADVVHVNPIFSSLPLGGSNTH